MIKSLEKALITLANEGISVGSLTLTQQQFDALLTEISETRMFGNTGLLHFGSFHINAPWGTVRIYRGVK